jgi:hypothetical protein
LESSLLSLEKDISNGDSDYSVASSAPEELSDKYSHPELVVMKTRHGDGETVSKETNRIKPMMARLDALQIQQQMQGMNHPDVLFALKYLAQAHRRRGEFQHAHLVEEMLRERHGIQEENIGYFY